MNEGSIRVWGGDYISSSGHLTLVCNIEVDAFDIWRHLDSSKSQYPGTQAILPNIFSDDNINPPGPLADKHTDLILVVGNNKIHCHKLVLRMTSKYFERMFASNMKESKSMEIELKEVDLETVTSLISFLYQGIIEDEKINVDLFAAAEMYEVLRLKSICKTKLAENMNMKNVAKIWHIVNLHNEDDLAHLAIIYMMKRWRNLSKQPDIEELCRKYPHLAWTISKLLTE